MTESEAKRQIKEHLVIAGCEDLFCDVEALETAIQALEEIQQYRAIGTVKQIRIREAQFKRLSEGYLNDLTSLREYQAIGTVEELKTMKENGAFTGVELAQILAMQMKLKKYQSIGTIDELQALKEKNEPKELAEHNFQDEVHHYLCPSCRSIVSCTQNYCDECGQALET